MNLLLFFRLIVMSIFQSMITHTCKHHGEDMCYDNQLFHCPRVFAKDGFNISLQINNCNYCSSNNGYRTLGHTMEKVEFGFPSMNEPLLWKYGERYGCEKYDEEGNEIPFDSTNYDVTGEVGIIPVEECEKVFEAHGGIDWEKTISIETFNMLVKD